jgi:hypothetical protein
MRIAAIALVTVLGLTACATQDTSKWPSPQTLQTGLTIAEAGWTAYCTSKHLDCTLAANAEKTAQDALTAYTQAYASGNVTQALLDNLNKAIADVAALIAQFQNKG